MIIKASVCAGLAGLLVSASVSAMPSTGGPTDTYSGDYTVVAQTQGTERRGGRRDDRGDRRGDRGDCRQEEGVVGKDKRDCKQEGRGDRKGGSDDQ